MADNAHAFGLADGRDQRRSSVRFQQRWPSPGEQRTASWDDAEERAGWTRRPTQRGVRPRTKLPCVGEDGPGQRTPPQGQ